MRAVFFVFAFALLAYAKGNDEHGLGGTGRNPTCACGWANRDSGRIVNGEPTKKFEYPMIAGLVVPQRMKLFCGGTIISAKHVLTAAHCLYRLRPSSVAVHVGSNSYERVKWNHNLYQSKSFALHRDWNMKNIVYDIALITIEGSFWKGSPQYGSNVGPACLPRLKVSPGDVVKVLGWGRLSSNGSSPADLLQVNLDVRPHTVCHKNNPSYAKQDVHQFCTYTPGKDSCQGDSGGPLLKVDISTNRYIISGVTSYGVGCAKYPAVNTEVGHFISWIQREIAQTPGAQTCSV